MKHPPRWVITEGYTGFRVSRGKAPHTLFVNPLQPLSEPLSLCFVSVRLSRPRTPRAFPPSRVGRRVIGPHFTLPVRTPPRAPEAHERLPCSHM